MKVNRFTCVVLNSILATLFGPTLIHSASSITLLEDRVDQPRTSRETQPLKLLHDKLFKNTPEFTGQQQQTESIIWSVPVGLLEQTGQTTPARDPSAADYLPKSTGLPDVTVTCSTDGFVLRVKRDFYGFSPVAEELTLGKNCKSNGVLPPSDDLLFSYALTDCQSEQQVLPDSIIYKFVLHYVPLPNRNPLRSHGVNVGVQCRFKRHHHVRPTWRTLYLKTIRSRLGGFRIQLMDESWSSPVKSAVYLLGQKVNVQVSTQHHYTGVKLYINSCYMTSINTLNQATKYSIIDNYGCLRETQVNPDDSVFRFSRADNVVQFSFNAFQFVDAPDSQISLHCELSVSGGGPSPTQKSCFYSHKDNRWISVFGQDSVCDCCDSVCYQTKTRRTVYEGFVSSEPVVFSNSVTSPLTTLASSTLDSNLLVHRNDEVIWFKAKLVEEPQRSHTHKDFSASVTLLPLSFENHARSQPESLTSTVKLKEEERKGIEEEEQGDVEVLIGTSESFVGFNKVTFNMSLVREKQGEELDSMKQFEGLQNKRTVSLFGSTEDRMTQSYWPEKAQSVGEILQKEVSMNTSVMINEEMGERSSMEESVLGNRGQQDVIMLSFITEEKEEHFSGNRGEGVDFLTLSEYEEDLEFPVGFDELMDQGIVGNLDLTKNPEYY